MYKALLIHGITVAALAISGCCARAYAQSMDYGALQDLYGEPVTTAATGTPQKASEVAANMTIITADEIRQSGARDIPTILSRVPGLDILQEAAQNWDVGVRGYQQPFQPRLLVLIDGRQVFIDDYSRMDWGDLPVNIDDIRQIEVVKGASSALFGSNATGGVVNIITYSPLYDKSNVASVSVGTQNELTGDATATIPLDDRGGLKISAGGLSMNEFGTPRPASETVNAVTNPYHRYVAQNSVFKLTNDFELNSEANFTEEQEERASFSYSLSPAKTSSYSVGGGFAWQTPYGLIKNTNYLNHYYIDIDALGELVTSNNLMVSQLEDQFKLGADHTFRAMIEYKYKEFKAEDYSDTSVTTFQYPDLNENSYAASGTWLWHINDKLSATNALRIDSNSMYMDGTLLPGNLYSASAYNQAYDTLSANSGLVYKVTDMDSFRATYGRGVQDPSEIQSGDDNIFAVSPTLYLNTVGNPSLKPTIVDNYELGYDRQIPDILSLLRFSTYYEFNHDLRANAPSGSLGSNAYGPLSETINVGNSQGWGGELELKGSHPSGLRWDASYSYQTIRDSELVSQTLGYATSAPEHHFILLLGYTMGKWEFDTNGQYVTSTDMFSLATNAGAASKIETAGYASLSGRIGYRIGDHATLSASAFTINHQDLQASPYPEIERQFLLTLTDRF